MFYPFDQSNRLDSTILDRFVARYKRLVSSEASVLVAASGGGDSTALLCMFHGLRNRLGIKRLGVLHVNHGLRGTESDGDEEFVADLARRLGCHFFRKKLSGRSLHDSGMEEWARKERYRFFRETREREGYDFIATGHTADDQAETVLMRIVRGAGLRGMRGVLPKRDDNIIRPLLDYWRDEVVGWLGAEGVVFRSDSSNDDHTFGRNRIRHEVLPLLEKRDPGARGKLVYLSELSRELWNAMQPGINRWIAAHVTAMDGRFRVEKAGFGDELHAAEGLRKVFTHYRIPTDSSHIEGVVASISRTSGTFLLPGGSWRYHSGRKTILFIDHGADAVSDFCYRIELEGITYCCVPGALLKVRELAVHPDELRGDNLTVVLDRDACGNELWFRSIRPGDRFVPLGASESVRVESFLAKQGVSSGERLLTGVVETGDGVIIWIPGIRISQDARVSRDTGRILELSLQSYSCAII